MKLPVPDGLKCNFAMALFFRPAIARSQAINSFLAHSMDSERGNNQHQSEAVESNFHLFDRCHEAAKRNGLEVQWVQVLTA
ncbi:MULTISPECIES: hypothetical protein [Pseudomonas]|uniref:hypothetical protein n=1 Tax=Pseudomonas TaxID=286 RepID=UPI00301E5DC7